jgi:hypothetical protein
MKRLRRSGAHDCFPDTTGTLRASVDYAAFQWSDARLTIANRSIVDSETLAREQIGIIHRKP